jgi:glucokinase
MSQAWALGIEIGGTKLQLGIGRGDGHILALERVRADTSAGAAGIRDQIEAGFKSVLLKADLAPSQVAAAGIGFGGPVDVANGRTQKSFQVSGWDGFPLAAWVRDRLGIPSVVLENDADTAGLAEARLGAGIGFSPLLYMNVGSGIGGALVIDGQIYRGFGHGATEIGHLRVPHNTPTEAYWAELEQAASGWAIASAAQNLARRKIDECGDGWPVLAQARGSPERITAAMVADAASVGDVHASAILDRARSAVAFALTQAITLLAPKRIVLGGGVSLIGDDLWFDPIRRLVDRDGFGLFRGHFDIVPAVLGEEVVVHGALVRAHDVLGD